MPEAKATITTKEYSESQQCWRLTCNITLPDGFRSGSHVSSLPQDATEAQLEADILAQYGYPRT